LLQFRGVKITQNGSKPSFAALRHGDFRIYLVATSAAMMADNIEHVISYWVMFEQFRSPALAGFAVLSHWLPFLFLSVYFGALADRFDSRRIIQIAMLLYMGVSLAWAVLFYTETIEVWHAAVLLVIHGIAGVLWAPASQLLIHDIVGRDNLVSAVRLNATGRQFGVFLGPAVGGGLMLALGPAAGLIANVLIYLPLTWWLWKVPYGARHHRAGAPVTGGGFGDALKVMREVSGNRTILSMILLAGISSLLVGNAFLAQMPEYAHDLGTEKADFSYAVLLAANAMKAAMAVLKPILAETGAEPVGKMVIGTVKGDIHDIGKNLVGMMLEGAGFEVVDLGINTDADKFLAALDEHKPDILGMSALLTTTMPYMKVVIQALKDRGMREDYIVLVGGAPLNEEFGLAVGADAYCRDAGVAAETARRLIDERRARVA